MYKHFFLVGYGMGYDDIVLHGNPDELTFMAFYLKWVNTLRPRKNGRHIAELEIHFHVGKNVL